jgi:hypothetical protein
MFEFVFVVVSESLLERLFLMSIFTKSESLYGAPADVYDVKFLGIEPMRDNGAPRLGRDGKPMPPGVEWRFEIISGPHAGKLVTRITSTTPTPKNACGTLLDGLLGRPVGIGEPVDTDAYVGKLFRAVVSQSTTNPKRTQVTQILPSNQPNQKPAFDPPSTSVFNPPSLPPEPEIPDADAVWVSYGADSGKPAQRFHRNEAQKEFDKILHGPDKDRIAKVKVMRGDQQGGWVAPEAMGFDTKVPF